MFDLELIWIYLTDPVVLIVDNSHQRVADQVSFNWIVDNTHSVRCRSESESRCPMQELLIGVYLLARCEAASSTCKLGSYFHGLGK
jgi:hypothetical protein